MLPALPAVRTLKLRDNRLGARTAARVIAVLPRLRELEAATFPNPAHRVWKAVFHAWRASVDAEAGEEARG